MRDEMTYRISYDETRTLAADRTQAEALARTEYFRTEHEALNRARELLETAGHHGVSLADASGNVLGGIRLQLKLGYTGE
jgi:hypothetical protein